MQAEYTTVPATVEETHTTNVEFITAPDASEKQPSVLRSVFRSIFVEGPRDFFGGIFHFFRRYFRHYAEALAFFRRPSLKVATFDSKDFKESSLQSFELALIFTAALLFMIKQNWVPVDKQLQEKYGNDLMQLFMEAAIFVIFALAYFAQLLLSIVAGRLVRVLFQFPLTRKESDVLFCYLNNAFFSLSALLAFFVRCNLQYGQIQGTEKEYGLYTFCVILSFFLVSWWSFNFARLNQLPALRRLAFFLISIVLFTALYGVGMSAVVSFVSGT